MCIYSGSSDIDENDVRLFLESEHLNVVGIVKVSHPESYTLSFHRTVQADAIEKLTSLDILLPEGIFC